MKVIDLLVKIANDEEIPKIIAYRNKVYRYNEDVKDYELDNERGWLMDISRDAGNEFLNDEVQIINEYEENKKIEKLNVWYGMKQVNANIPIDIEKTIDSNSEMFFRKINEIIDYINKKV